MDRLQKNNEENKRILIQEVDDEFYHTLNSVLSQKVTPLYNAAILVFAVVFGYFAVTEENQCFAKGQKAFSVQYSDTVDVSRQFYMMSYFGLVILVFSALIYHLQSKEGMFEAMRPFVIFVSLIQFIWFLFLQYYRYKETGRACSGDYLEQPYPSNYSDLYLIDQGKWLNIYIASHYALFLVSKLVQVLITNKISVEFEERKAQIRGKV